MKKIVIVFCLLWVSINTVLGEGGVIKKRPLPHEYGQVVMNNYAERAGIAPVVFDHWLHRSKFTCRLCHVDLAFAMKTGETKVKAADNMKGYYCGACHNGKMTHEERVIFEACSKNLTDDTKRCDRCHSQGRYVKKQYDFYDYTKQFAKERFGNGINWVKTEADGAVALIDTIEGISIKRAPLPVDKDFSLYPKVRGMPEIIFSHNKHVVWNSCELCHPEVFPSVKRGSKQYSMLEIFEGKYCGVCHTSVAFPLIDCQRCHSKPVM